MVAGIVMLRYGILATLIWHYTVDASLVGLLLVRSNSMYFKISGCDCRAAALRAIGFFRALRICGEEILRRWMIY